ncbi:DUF1308 domain-containing protein [Microbulbifer sp. MKSA007]|nr:DUF1308 domain-containing protein [Microbulbifer sp. MKSA007]
MDTGSAIAFISEGSSQRGYLKSIVKDKKMIMTKMAKAEFENIVSGVAGEKEKARAKRFLEKVKVVEDDPSERAKKLIPSKKVGENDIVIFGTGDKRRAITLTADKKFLSGASYQKVDFDAIVHDPVPLKGD